MEAGAHLVDTVPLYGGGRSETLIGRALRARRDLAANCILSTKTGRYGAVSDYSYDRTLRSMERSLERLGVSHLPIVHIHGVSTEEELTEILRSKAAHTALRKLQSEGIIDSIGIGTRSLDALHFALKSGEFDVVMIANQYNLLEQAGRPVIEEARQRDIGVIIAGAYATGILAKGNADPRSQYLYRPADQGVRQRVAELGDMCRRWGCSLAGIAVQFCLRGPVAVAVTVLGARGRQQAEENAVAVAEQIPSGLWVELDTWLQTHAQAGPRGIRTS